jgi:hypothetical protein
MMYLHTKPNLLAQQKQIVLRCTATAVHCSFRCVSVGAIISATVVLAVVVLLPAVTVSANAASNSGAYRAATDTSAKYRVWKGHCITSCVYLL